MMPMRGPARPGELSPCSHTVFLTVPAIAAHQDPAVAVFVEDRDLGSITGAPIMFGFLQAAATAGQP